MKHNDATRRAYAIEEADRRSRREKQWAVVYRPDGKPYYLVATGPSLAAIATPGVIVYSTGPAPSPAPLPQRRPAKGKADAVSDVDGWRCPACGGDKDAPNPQPAGGGKPKLCHKTRHQAEAARRRQEKR